MNCGRAGAVTDDKISFSHRGVGTWMNVNIKLESYYKTVGFSFCQRFYLKSDLFTIGRELYFLFLLVFCFFLLLLFVDWVAFIVTVIYNKYNINDWRGVINALWPAEMTYFVCKQALENYPRKLFCLAKQSIFHWMSRFYVLQGRTRAGLIVSVAKIWKRNSVNMNFSAKT